jgi:hypothetical protein
MSNLKSVVHNVFYLAMLVFWLAAIGVLGWQSWNWLSTGNWETVPVSAAFAHIGGMPVGFEFYSNVAFGVLAAQSLALVAALLGGVCSFIARITD